MSRIDDCIECYQCSERCPYELDTPALLKKMQAEYNAYLFEPARAFVRAMGRRLERCSGPEPRRFGRLGCLLIHLDRRADA